MSLLLTKLNIVFGILQKHIQSTQKDSMTREEFHKIMRVYEHSTAKLSDANINSYFELAAKSAGVDVVYVEDVLNLFRYFIEKIE